MAAASAALLVFTTLLLSGVLSDSDPSSCRTPNYQYSCRRDSVCEYSVSWGRETKNELSLRVSTLVSEPEGDSWSTAISLSRASIEAVLTCSWRQGETSYHCSVDCVSANITYHDHHLDCRFMIKERVISELTSAPVSLHISTGNSSAGVSPACPCDITDCQDVCDSCVTETGDSNRCHSVISLLLIRFHAIFMVLTFLLLVPTGVTISRYSRPVCPHSWFRSHAIINSASLVLTLLGLGAVLGHTRGHFTAGLHQVAGIICISLVFFQALCGYLRPATGISLQRRVFNMVHKINGATILGLGTLAMVLGAVMYHNSVYPLVVLVLVMAVVVELLFFLAFEIIMRRNYMISVPVGYQKVEGGDGEEEEGEGERGGEGEKGQELRVMNGSAGGGGEKTATKKKGSKPPQSHTVTKRLLDAFVVQGFLFCAAIGVIIMYGSH